MDGDKRLRKRMGMHARGLGMIRYLTRELARVETKIDRVVKEKMGD